VPVPAGNGGQREAHVPVQLLVPEVSLADVYSVKPAEFTSIVLPRVALLAVSTVSVDVIVRVGDGVVVELLLPPHAALIDKAKSRPVDARSAGKRLTIGLLSVSD
jgi:hypothetical protein